MMLQILMSIMLVGITLSKDCRTSEGEKCKFPFVYNGKTFRQCTKEGWDKLWCATETGWGRCTSQCEDINSQKCQCGMVNTHGNWRISGGVTTDIEDNPWQAGIIWYSEKIPYCGGTLISDRHVLTAAHCTGGYRTISPYYIRVLLGDDNMDDSYFEPLKVRKIVNHPDYHKDQYNVMTDDLSILTLTKPVKFSHKIKPACLPSHANENYLNQVATVSGWGSVDGGKQPYNLMKVDVKVTNVQNCGWSTESEHHVCAYGWGKDACRGDSGGPLVAQENDRYTVIGVVSYGDRCSAKKDSRLGVYARVSKRLNWIHENSEGTFNSRCEAN